MSITKSYAIASKLTRFENQATSTPSASQQAPQKSYAHLSGIFAYGQDTSSSGQLDSVRKRVKIDAFATPNLGYEADIVPHQRACAVGPGKLDLRELGKHAGDHFAVAYRRNGVARLRVSPSIRAGLGSF